MFVSLAPQKPFQLTLEKFLESHLTPVFWPHWAIFEVRIKPLCDYTFRAGPDLMWSSSWASNSDDFPFFGSSIAHLELKLHPFENWSLFVEISATWGGFGYRRGRVAEIPTNIDQFSNGCNSASRWAIEDPKKRKIIRIWCPRWWSHQIRSSSEGIVTQGLYSYLKNNFWVKKMQFWRFLKKIPAATFFVNWFRKWLPRPLQRCRNRQWYI